MSRFRTLVSACTSPARQMVRERYYEMLDRALARERIEAEQRSAPAVSKSVAKEYRTLAREMSLGRDPATGVVVDLNAYGRDLPTLEQYARGGFERKATGEIDSIQGVSRAWWNKDGTALQRLFNRDQISYRQAMAGFAHNQVWTLARLDPRVVADYGSSMGGGSGGASFLAPSEAVAEWRRKLAAARAAIGDRLRVECVEAVVCFDQTCTSVGLKLGNRGRSAERKGSEIVKAGLDALAKHYGITDRED